MFTKVWPYLLITLFSSNGFGAVRYRVVNLEAQGTVTSPSSGAIALNSRGDVAGNFWTPGFIENRVFRYTDASGMLDLRFPGRGTVRGGFAVGLNDYGQLVVEGPARPRGPSQLFRYTDGKGYVNLGTLGGRESQASGTRHINNRGQVTGSSERADGFDRAFRYTDGIGMEDLGTLFGGRSSGRGINELGWVVGGSDEHAFLFRDDVGMIDLGPGLAVGLNDIGTVTGSSELPDGTFSAFVYRDGTLRIIGTLGGDASGHSVNNHNVVVGWSLLESSFRAFIWTEQDGMVNLNRLIPLDSGWLLAVANSINDAGQVAGYGLLNGKPTAWRLDPITPQ
jgi:probable HAF family extracellular repeat protein